MTSVFTSAFRYHENWLCRPSFRANESGGWSFFPSPWSRIGYRIDDATKERLQRVRRKVSWAAMAFLGLSMVAVLYPNFRHDGAPPLAPGVASMLVAAVVLGWALTKFDDYSRKQRELEIVADTAPSIVVLPRDVFCREVEQLLLFGYPKVVAILFSLPLIVAVRAFLVEEPSWHRPIMFLYLVLTGPYVMRAWVWIFRSNRLVR